MNRRYFDDLYGSDPDPWRFESSWYEQRKYALTMAALPESRYRSAFEPGCSIGVLTSLLARRCDELLATDVVAERARNRCRTLPGVTLEVRPIPEEWPTGPFDLVVLSEIAYYFDRRALDEIMTRLLDTVVPRATIVRVHWRGRTNYPLSGDQVHETIDSYTEFESTVHHVEPDFVLDVWNRVP
jgi:trans-aconitate methyltransferase